MNLSIRIVSLGPRFVECTCPAKDCKHCGGLPYCPYVIDYPAESAPEPPTNTPKK